jgi:hypothetical protein
VWEHVTEGLAQLGSKMDTTARCQWLTIIILGFQEAETRRITVQAQPRQIVPETLSPKKRDGRVAQDVGPEFHEKKKKKGTLDWRHKNKVKQADVSLLPSQGLGTRTSHTPLLPGLVTTRWCSVSGSAHLVPRVGHTGC